MLQLNNRAVISFFLVVASLNSYAQNKEELKQKKEVLEEEIKFTNELLNQTKAKKTSPENCTKFGTTNIEFSFPVTAGGSSRSKTNARCDKRKKTCEH